jgi:hypothetical protein
MAAFVVLAGMSRCRHFMVRLMHTKRSTKAEAVDDLYAIGILRSRYQLKPTYLRTLNPMQKYHLSNISIAVRHKPNQLKPHNYDCPMRDKFRRHVVLPALYNP